MQDRDRIKCPHCNGTGAEKIPGFKNGQPIVKEKICKHCKGDGKLVLVVDAKIFNGKKAKKNSNIITPKSGIILPPGVKKK